MFNQLFRFKKSKTGNFCQKLFSVWVSLILLVSIIPLPTNTWAEELVINPMAEESTTAEIITNPVEDANVTPPEVVTETSSNTPVINEEIPSSVETPTIELPQIPESSSNTATELKPEIITEPENISSNSSKNGTTWLEKKQGQLSAQQNLQSASVSTLANPALFIANEIIVNYKDKSQTEAEITTLENEANISEKEKITADSSLFTINDNDSVMTKINELSQNKNVEYAQPNYVYHSQSLPNDTDFNKLWTFYNSGQAINGNLGENDADIDGIEAWNMLSSQPQLAIVAIIDTGVDYYHEDLKNMMWDGSSTCYDENNNLITGGCPYHGRSYYYNGFDDKPLPYFSHGTHVAGIVAAEANNSLGVAGLASNAKIMALATDLTTASLTKSIQFAENNGAKVINASWGGTGYSCSYANDTALYEAIKNFSGLFITAAGNDGEELSESFVDIPAMFAFNTSCWTGLDNIITVASTNNKDELSYFSNYSDEFVHVGAPGENIYSTMPSEGAEITVYEAKDSFTNFTNTGNWGVPTAGFDGQSIFLKTDINNFPYTETTGGKTVSPIINLASKSAATLSFKVNCDTEYTTEDWSDYVNVDISANGTSYSTIARFDEDMVKRVNGIYNDSTGYTGWTEITDLEIPTNYLTNNFSFRFTWYLNGNNDHGSEGGGCMFDDIKITTPDLNNIIGKYAYNSGTSMATPQVTALTALLQGIDPTASNETIKSIILNSGDAIPALTGKTTSQKRINAAKAVAYLYFLKNYSNEELLDLAQMMYELELFGDIENYTADMELTGNITRAELYKIIFKARKLPVEQIDNVGFIDINSNDWFYNYANSAVYYGLITMPSDHLFKANDAVSQAEIIKALLLTFVPNYQNFADPLAPFTDDNDHPSENLFSSAYNLSIIDGNNNATIIEPDKQISRVDFYYLLAKTIIVSADPESYVRFADGSPSFSVFELEDIIDQTRDLLIADNSFLPCDIIGNSIYTAELISSNTSREANLCTNSNNNGDIDYYKIELNNVGNLRVYTTSNLDLAGALENELGNLLVSNGYNNNSYNNFDFNVLVSPGIYYIKVQGYNSDQIGNYTLHTIFNPIVNNASLNITTTDNEILNIVEGNTDAQKILTLDLSTNNELVQINSLEFTYNGTGNINDFTNLELTEIVNGQKKVLKNIITFNANNKALFSLNNYYLPQNSSKRLYLYAKLKNNVGASTYTINLLDASAIKYNGNNITADFPLNGNPLTIIPQNKVLSRIKNIYGDYFFGFNDFIIYDNYIYAVGSLGYDEISVAIITKFDLNLNLIDQKKYDGAYREFFTKIIAQNGYLFVSGSMTDNLYSDNKGIILKYDTNLNLLVNKTYSSTKLLIFRNLIADEQNIFVVVENYEANKNLIIKFDHNLNLITYKVLNTDSFTFTMDENYLYGLFSDNIIKLDKNLNLLLSKSIVNKNESYNNFNSTTILTQNNQIFLLGTNYNFDNNFSNHSIGILKLDTNFNLLQQKTYQVNQIDEINYKSAYIDNNNLYLLSDNEKIGQAQSENIVLKLSHNLEIIGQKQLSKYDKNGNKMPLYFDFSKIKYFNHDLYILAEGDNGLLIKTNEKVFTDEFLLPGKFTWTNSNVVAGADLDFISQDLTVNFSTIVLTEVVTTPNTAISNYLSTSEDFVYDLDRTCNVNDWQVGNWSDCINGIKTRSIIKISLCVGENNKPAVSEVCSVIGSGSSSSGGGGGGGGGKTANFNTVYDLPTSPSEEILHLNRPVKTTNGEFSRPVVIEDYYSKSSLSISKNTKVTDFNGKVYPNAIPPISKKSISKTSNITPPLDKKLVYNSYFLVAGENLLFSEPVKVEIILPASLKKYTSDQTNYKIMYWVPKQRLSQISQLVASTDIPPTLDGEWRDLGGADLVKDGKINFIVSHSTYVSFVSENNQITTTDTQILLNTDYFTDIDKHWAKDSINKMYELGVVKGRNGSNKFLPNEKVKRTEFIKMVLELLDYNVDNVDLSNNPFVDVSNDDWFAPYVVKAYQEGIIYGYEQDGYLYFNPNNDIIRAEALAIVLLAEKREVPAEFENVFIDVPNDTWFAHYVSYGYKEGIMNGRSPSEFAPAENLTRAEAVTILMRVYELRK